MRAESRQFTRSPLGQKASSKQGRIGNKSELCAEAKWSRSKVLKLDVRIWAYEYVGHATLYVRAPDF